MDAQSDRRQRLYRLSAIVLKRRDTGEADRLLTVLTADRGKLTLLAKGVRRSASRKAGHIEPFTYVQLLVAKGRSLHLVTQAETMEAHRHLREDLWLSAWAYYVAELADAFIRDEDPHAPLFDLLLETLGRLDQGNEPALAVRYYELHLLGLAGFQPQLFRCLQCGELLKPEVNFFSLERGGALCPQHGANLQVGSASGANQGGSFALPLATLKVLRYLQTRPWGQVAQLRLSERVSQQVEAVLAQYITHHLERQLRSPVFLERLKPAAAPVARDAVPRSGIGDEHADP